MQDIDVLRMTINIASAAVSLLSLYYALRLSIIFRSGILQKSWRGIAIGIILVSIANLIFLARTIAMAEGTSQVLLYAGAMTAFMGGLFVLFGLRKEYKLWHDFAKEKEKPVTTEQKVQS
ncbi:MAG TPA: hypothetical protein VIH03_00510 [Nitrososphaerales archaeon]